MSSSRSPLPLLFVHETKPYWAPVLQYCFLNIEELEVLAVPQQFDLLKQMQIPHAWGLLVALEESADEPLLKLMLRAADRLHLFVLCPLQNVEQEWLWREAGAASVLSAETSVAELVRTLRHRLQSRNAPVVPPSN